MREIVGEGKWDVPGMMTRTGRFSSFAKFVVLFQFLTNAVVILDVMFVRQIVCLIYLTFIPGIVVLKMFKWDKRDFCETVLLSAGLSIALLMFIGLAVNQLYPLIGIYSPLSTLPLLITMNFVVLLPCFLGYLKDASITISAQDVPYRALLLICIPVLGIAGVFSVNNFGDNFLILLMIVIISGLTVVGALHKNLLPAKIYPLVLLAISFALLFHTSLVTDYIVGYDIHGEYHVFKLTENIAHWDSQLSFIDERLGKASAMLSTTILPAIYSKVVSMDATWTFKILYPLILSFVPLALYHLFSTQMKNKVAFLSVFFLMSNIVFFGLFAAKQMTAELFLVLLYIVLLKEKMRISERSLLFVIFSAALIVSHYATSYLFMFLILFTWLYMYRTHRSTEITDSRVLMFLLMVFSWYIFTSASAPFDSIIGTGDHVIRNFVSDFLNPESRSIVVLTGLGVGEKAISIGHSVGRVFFYITEFFIIIGFAKVVLNKKDTNLSQGFRVFSFFFMAMLAMSVVVPNLAGSLRMERLYEISLLFLAPYCILGGQTIFRWLLKRKNDVSALNLIIIVLIPFFLFESGFIYEVTGDVSYSLPLGMHRMDNITLYQRITDEQEVSGAQWIRKHLDVSNESVYADLTAIQHVLTSYGMMSIDNLGSRLLTNNTKFQDDRAYVYLRRVNIVDGTAFARRARAWNTTEILPTLNNQNKIYSNGACEIYSNPTDK